MPNINTVIVPAHWYATLYFPGGVEQKLLFADKATMLASIRLTWSGVRDQVKICEDTTSDLTVWATDSTMKTVFYAMKIPERRLELIASPAYL